MAAFAQQIDELGKLSAEAQALRTPITSYEKLLSQDIDQVLLLCVDNADSTAIGYIKFGIKTSLYFYKPPKGQLLQRDPMCLLDFFVLESRQRAGIGRKLFQAFLQMAQLPAGEVAYDRPSPKLLPFLAKHHRLTAPDHQPNRYTVFPAFFASLS